MASLLESLSSSPAGELFTSRAFDYKQDDVSEPLSRRFRGRQLLLLSVGTRQMRLGLASFDAQGVGRIEPGVQNLAVKNAGALTDHLRSVVRSAVKGGTAPWVVVLVAHGWTAETVSMAFHGTDRERMEKMRDTPEDVVGKALPTSQEHAVVPHPMLEASVVFSTKNSVLEGVIDSIKEAGLKVARVQNSVASMFEAYVHNDPDGAQARDLLIYDHQGVMLLMVENKMWMKVRYRSTQPDSIANDIAKFLHEERSNSSAPLTVLGQRGEMLDRVFAEEGQPSEVVYPFQEDITPEFTSAVCAEIEPHLAHDINPDHQPARPPLPKSGRLVVAGYLLAALTLTGLIVGNVVVAVSRQNTASSVRRDTEAIVTRALASEAEGKLYEKEVARADEIAAWVRCGYHPQRFLLGILRRLPETVVLVNVEAKMAEGLLQMEFAMTLDGSPEAQAEAMSKVEQEIFAQGIRIVTREPAPNGARSMTYRFTLLLPSAGETTATLK